MRIDLPTPDLLAVRHHTGATTVFADTSLPDQLVDQLVTEVLDELDT